MAMIKIGQNDMVHEEQRKDNEAAEALRNLCVLLVSCYIVMRAIEGFWRALKRPKGGYIPKKRPRRPRARTRRSDDDEPPSGRGSSKVGATGEPIEVYCTVM